MTFGIICAMPEELHALSERLTDRTETVLGENLPSGND